jgi:transcriptional regulator with XRE-family HTH domain
MGNPTTLRSLRGQACLTQRELAEAAGVSLTTIAALEAGRTTTPLAPTVGKLARALGIPFEELKPVLDGREAPS